RDARGRTIDASLAMIRETREVRTMNSRPTRVLPLAFVCSFALAFGASAAPAGPPAAPPALATSLGKLPPHSLAFAPGPADNPLKGLVPYYMGADYPKKFPHSMEWTYF